MTRGVRIVSYLLLALIALVVAFTHLAVPFVGGVITRLLVAGAVAVAAWWVVRDIRDID
jgi:uncharacterized membrane-anchored protein